MQIHSLPQHQMGDSNFLDFPILPLTTLPNTGRWKHGHKFCSAMRLFPRMLTIHMPWGFLNTPCLKIPPSWAELWYIKIRIEQHPAAELLSVALWGAQERTADTAVLQRKRIWKALHDIWMAQNCHKICRDSFINTCYKNRVKLKCWNSEVTCPIITQQEKRSQVWAHVLSILPQLFVELKVSDQCTFISSFFQVKERHNSKKDKSVVWGLLWISCCQI